MGNCLACLKSSSDTPQSQTTTIALSNLQPPIDKLIQKHDADRLEAVELLHNTNIQSLRTSIYDSNNYKKSLVVLNGGASSNLSLIDDKVVQSAKESQIADNAINKLFEEYKDENDDTILSEGIEKLCSDLGYSPDEFPILVLAFCLDAKQMCCFTKQEFIYGVKKLNATTISELKMRLIQIIEKLQTDMELFKQLYRFTFRFGLEYGHRILNIDMAIILWRLVYTIHAPDVLDRWLSFLENENIRGIQRDTWLMFLNFSESFDINLYDDNEAWPSLMDSFVEFELDRLKKIQQNEELKKSEDERMDSDNNNSKISFNDNDQINNLNQNFKS
ncbi:unnamed protein product [Diamesa hyperborea]